MIYYVYGMRLRGYGPGCQPMQNLIHVKKGDKQYWNYLVYSVKLPQKMEHHYDLDYLGVIDDDHQGLESLPYNLRRD